MKKILFLILVVSAFASAENRTKFSINPVSLFAADVQNFQVERTFFDGTWGWAFYFAESGQATRKLGGARLYGAEQSVAAKYYPNTVFRSGVWLGGKVSVASANAYGSDGFASNVGTLGVLGLGGYQWNFGGFFIDPFAGAGVALTNNLFKDARYSGNMNESHLLLNLGVQVGVSF